MIPQVTVPIRLRLDAPAAADGSYRPLLRAALTRALARAAATAPAGTVSAPVFRWHGPGLAELPAGTRERVEREVRALVAGLRPAAAPPAGPGRTAPTGPARKGPAAARPAFPPAPSSLPRGFTVRPRSVYDIAEEGRPALWLTEAMTVREAAARLYGRPDDWRLLVYWYNRDLWSAEHTPVGGPLDVAGRILPPGQRLRVEPGLLSEGLRREVLAAAAGRAEREREQTGGVRLTVETAGPVPRGSTVRIGLHLPEDVYPVEVEWQVRPDPALRASSLFPLPAAEAGPRGRLTGPRNAEPHLWDLPAGAVGAHVVSCRLHHGGEFWQEVSTSVLVLEPEDLARVVLRSDASPPADLATLRRRREAEYRARVGALAGDPRERGSTPYLVAEPDGATTTGSSVRYQLSLAQSLAAEARFAWSVRALDPPAPGEWRSPYARGLAAMAWGFFERHESPVGWLREGRRFNDSWTVTWDEPGTYEITCTVTAHGTSRTTAPVVQQVRTVVGSRPAAAPGSLRAAHRELTAGLAFLDLTLARGEAVPLRAAWVAGEGEPVAVPLDLYATLRPDAPATGTHLRIWDHSPAGRQRWYDASGDTPAEALDRALRELARAPYPRGAVLVETGGFTLGGRAFPARGSVVRTTGGEVALAEFLAKFSTFLFVTGAMLSIAGAPYVGGPLIAVSQVGAGAATLVRLHDRARSGNLHADEQTLTDLLDLAGNVTGAVGRGAGLLRIEPAGGLRFVASVDGVLGKTQLVVTHVALAARLDAAVKTGDRRQVADALLEAAWAGALLKLGALAERAGTADTPAATATATAAHPAAHPGGGAPVVVRHGTVDPGFVEALPPELRSSVELLAGGRRTVQIRYDFEDGGFRMRILAGPEATEADARQHLDAIRGSRDPQTWRGGLRLLADGTRAVLRGDVPQAPYTRAWDARQEIAKLTPIIAELRARRPLGRADRARLRDLERQLSEHRRALADPDLSVGGVIAAEDRRGRRRTPRAPLDAAGQVRAAEKVQRTDRAMAMSETAAAEQSAAATAAEQDLGAIAGERPAAPASLRTWLDRVGRLADYEERLDELDDLAAEPGRTAQEQAYLAWLRRSWSLRHEATEASEAVAAGSREKGNLRTAAAAGEAELRRQSKDLIDVMREEGPNYRAKGAIEYDEVIPAERRAKQPKEERPEKLATDHLVALDRISKLPEITPLLRLYAEASRTVQSDLRADLKGLGDIPENLVRMNAQANGSSMKTNKSWHEITYEQAEPFHYLPSEVRAMRTREDAALAEILRRIEDLTVRYTARMR